MIQHSSDIAHLASALHSVQGAVEGVKRDGANPHFRSKYATLENVIDTARPALQAAGIVFTQAPGAIVDGAVEVTTMLIHYKSGQWLRSTLHVPLGKRDPQGVGSAITYGLRYSLMATLGLPPTDDDGEAAMERTGKPTGGNGNGRVSAYQARKDNRWPPLIESLRACPTMEALYAWNDEHEAEIGDLPDSWRNELREEWKARAQELKTR